MADADQNTPGSFDLLARGVQRCLWDLGWSELRPIQSDTIRALHESPDHVLIMAETAGGKTEAAFLPLLSRVSHEPLGSVRIVYVGPLKALINDQFGRVESLCKHLEVPVHRWHGDVGDSARKRLTKEPGGVLLITPESIESLLVNRTAHLPKLFGGLRAVVIDELHAFLGTSRGLHLSSLLDRLSAYGSYRDQVVTRLGLSATIGDVAAAKSFLDRADPERVRVITDSTESKELLLRLHLYPEPEPAPDQGESSDEDHDARAVAVRRIASDLVDHCAARSNLVFCNAKGEIELLADACNETAREQGLPPAFLVHHGSLSKEFREDAEHRLKSDRPYTAICSSTLEMGIDIGSVYVVGQVGPPWSVASLKQRLGRSGRRDDEPRRLRVYVIEDAKPEAKDPIDRLPLRLLQSVAVLDLMLREKWIEPLGLSRRDLSTFAQQVISVISEWGAAEASFIYDRLCVGGPFSGLDKGEFVEVMRQLGAVDVIEQTSQGSLILGLEGERIRASRDFYAVFETPIEYRLVNDGKEIGTLPATVVPAENSHLLFAGRRWRVESVDPDRLEILVVPARGAKRPLFMGQPGTVHRRIRERMLDVLCEPPPMPYADQNVRAILERAGAGARADRLDRREVVALSDQRCRFVTWTGTTEQRTLMALLQLGGIDVEDEQIAICCAASAEDVRWTLASFVKQPPTALALGQYAMRSVPPRKYDHLLGDRIRAMSVALEQLDLDSAFELIEELLGGAAVRNS